MLNQIASIAVSYEDRFTDASRHSTSPPTCYESITSEWLTSILCANVPEALVTGYRVCASRDIGGRRKKLRVEYNAAGCLSELPQSLFCKIDHHASTAALTETLGTSGCETRFYDDVRPYLGIETPRCIYNRFDPRYPSSIVVLQDVESNASEPCTHTTAITRDLAEGQLKLLAHLHSQCHEGTELFQRLHHFPHWAEYFVRWQKLGIREDVRRGFHAARDVIPPNLYRRFDQVWPAAIASVERHARLPHTLIHCDLQLKNWYVTANGAMGLYDWENAMRGHWSRDVTHALATSLTVDNRRDWERELLLYYINHMEAGGVSVGAFEEVWRDYRQQMLIALIWWTLILGAETERGGDAGAVTLEFIRRAATAVDDLDSLSSF